MRDAPNDKKDLLPAIQAVQTQVVGGLKKVLAECGLYTSEPVQAVESSVETAEMAAA